MPFDRQDVELLEEHLKAIVAVETMTVPLYLAAVYSFTEDALGYSPDGGNSYPLYTLQQAVLSVAVQEMYHLQLACNLCNAFQIEPEIPRLKLVAGADIEVPHIEEEGKPIITKIGNVASVIKAFIDIEEPSEPPFAAPNDKVVYRSIADLYSATLQLLSKYMQAWSSTATTLDPHFKPDNKQIAYATFAGTYMYNKIGDRTHIAKVASAVTDQGEGNIVAAEVGGHFGAGGSDGVLPEYQPKAGSRFSGFGKETHFKRFEWVASMLAAEDWASIIGAPVFYEANGAKSPDLPRWAADHTVLADAMSTLWSYTVDIMQAGFSTGRLADGAAFEGGPTFGDAMLSFKYVTPQMWQWGQAPSFVYREGVTPQDAQQAMDLIDPLCLFHFDARTLELRAQRQFNACQGLNECAGRGWGGIATEKGNGACATVELHTCGGNNACRLHGGCGYLVSRTGESCGGGPVGKLFEPSEEWIPGANSCRGHGGCQTPISTRQVFNRAAGPNIAGQTGPGWTPEAKAQLDALRGTGVWDRARELFAARFGLSQLPVPRAEKVGVVSYDGGARRAAIAPTSK